MAKRKATDVAAAEAPAAPAPAAVLQASTSAPVVNKERVLIVSSRGITSRRVVVSWGLWRKSGAGRAPCGSRKWGAGARVGVRDAR